MNIELTKEELGLLKYIAESENSDEVWAKIELYRQVIESILSKSQESQEKK